MPYIRRQIGSATLGGTLGAMVLMLALMTVTPWSWIGVGTLAIVGLAAVLFGWLTVFVEADHIGARFGVGLIQRTVPFSAIRSYGRVRNSWLAGWGLRIIPRGTLWNVGGFEAVELRLEGERVWRIGTDEPEALCAAIHTASPELPRQDGPNLG